MCSVNQVGEQWMDAAKSYKQLAEYAEGLNSSIDHYQEFRGRCKQHMECRMGKVTQEQFDKVFESAWRDGHGSGYIEVVIIFDNLLDVVAEFTL